MNRRQRNAAIVALVIVGMVLAAALFVTYDRPSDEYSGIPTIQPYINDDVGVLTRAGLLRPGGLLLRGGAEQLLRDRRPDRR